MTAKRPIVSFPKGRDGLFLEPDALTPDMARVIDHNRERFASHFNYADCLGAGNANTYDDRGDYNCGRCNQAEGNKCLLLKIPQIDRTAGSCEDWEKCREGDAEMRLYRKNPEVANYGVAKNGLGFGCHRCPYAKPAKNIDSEGRTYWCGEGAFHVVPTACCTANGAETLPQPDYDDDDDDDKPVGRGSFLSDIHDMLAQRGR
jgi:hypothetical protein